jgi:hypothetical protein
MKLVRVTDAAPHVKDQYRVTDITAEDVGNISDEFRSFVATLGNTGVVTTNSIAEFARQVRVRYSAAHST